jgi:hypothetical protein
VGIDRALAQVFGQGLHLRQAGLFLPARQCSQALTGLQRLILSLSHQPYKAAAAQHRHHAGQGLCGLQIDVQQPRRRRRRLHHRAVQKAGQFHIVHKAGLAQHLGRQVQALLGLRRRA